MSNHIIKAVIDGIIDKWWAILIVTIFSLIVSINDWLKILISEIPIQVLSAIIVGSVAFNIAICLLIIIKWPRYSWSDQYHCWKQNDTDRHFCPKCETKSVPMRFEKTGYRCISCEKFYRDKNISPRKLKTDRKSPKNWSILDIKN